MSLSLNNTYKRPNFKLKGVTKNGLQEGIILNANEFTSNLNNLFIGDISGSKTLEDERNNLGLYNTFVGPYSGSENKNGSKNTFVGYQTNNITELDNANENINIGYESKSINKGEKGNNINIGRYLTNEEFISSNYTNLQNSNINIGKNIVDEDVNNYKKNIIIGNGNNILADINNNDDAENYTILGNNINADEKEVFYLKTKVIDESKYYGDSTNLSTFDTTLKYNSNKKKVYAYKEYEYIPDMRSLDPVEIPYLFFNLPHIYINKIHNFNNDNSYKQTETTTGYNNTSDFGGIPPTGDYFDSVDINFTEKKNINTYSNNYTGTNIFTDLNFNTIKNTTQTLKKDLDIIIYSHPTKFDNIGKTYTYSFVHNKTNGRTIKFIAYNCFFRGTIKFYNNCSVDILQTPKEIVIPHTTKRIVIPFDFEMLNNSIFKFTYLGVNKFSEQFDTSEVAFSENNFYECDISIFTNDNYDLNTKYTHFYLSDYTTVPYSS